MQGDIKGRSEGGGGGGGIYYVKPVTLRFTLNSVFLCMDGCLCYTVVRLLHQRRCMLIENHMFCEILCT